MTYWLSEEQIEENARQGQRENLKRAERERVEREAECGLCGGSLASNGACADDTCGDED